MSNRTYLTVGFDSQPKNGQIVIMLYAFQDILAKYLNSHLPVIVETNPVPSAKVANAAFLAEDILFRSWKQITFHRNRASVLIGGAIKIGWSRTVVQSWHRLFFLYFAQPWVATGQAKRCYKGESDQAGSVEISKDIIGWFVGDEYDIEGWQKEQNSPVLCFWNHCAGRLTGRSYTYIVCLMRKKGQAGFLSEPSPDFWGEAAALAERREQP